MLLSDELKLSTTHSGCSQSATLPLLLWLPFFIDHRADSQPLELAPPGVVNLFLCFRLSIIYSVWRTLFACRRVMGGMAVEGLLFMSSLDLVHTRIVFPGRSLTRIYSENNRDWIGNIEKGSRINYSQRKIVNWSNMDFSFIDSNNFLFKPFSIYSQKIKNQIKRTN